MVETIEELRLRRDLLAEIVALSARLPDEDEMEAAADHLATLKAIENCDSPDEDYMADVSNHLAVLRAIDGMDKPAEDEMEAASDHLAVLKETEQHSNAE